MKIDKEKRIPIYSILEKYVVKKVNMATRETKLYTWIPYLAKATGFMGGYLWHTIKQLAHTGIHPKDQANDFHIRHSYRDIGVNKDGIGNFFNFTIGHMSLSFRNRFFLFK